MNRRTATMRDNLLARAVHMDIHVHNCDTHWLLHYCRHSVYVILLLLCIDLSILSDYRLVTTAYCVPAFAALPRHSDIAPGGSGGS